MGRFFVFSSVNFELIWHKAFESISKMIAQPMLFTLLLQISQIPRGMILVDKKKSDHKKTFSVKLCECVDIENILNH